MKLNYNGLIKEIVEALGTEEIEYLQENAWHIEIGLQLLNGYLNELAEHSIETQDEWLIEWCKNLLIITETEEEGGSENQMRGGNPLEQYSDIPEASGLSPNG